MRIYLVIGLLCLAGCRASMNSLNHFDKSDSNVCTMKLFEYLTEQAPGNIDNYRPVRWSHENDACVLKELSAMDKAEFKKYVQFMSHRVEEQRYSPFLAFFRLIQPIINEYPVEDRIELILLLPKKNAVVVMDGREIHAERYVYINWVRGYIHSQLNEILSHEETGDFLIKEDSLIPVNRIEDKGPEGRYKEASDYAQAAMKALKEVLEKRE